MQSEISACHEELMECERIKDELSWMLSFATDEKTISLLSVKLNMVIVRGLHELEIIDIVSGMN